MIRPAIRVTHLSDALGGGLRRWAMPCGVTSRPMARAVVPDAMLSGENGRTRTVRAGLMIRVMQSADIARAMRLTDAVELRPHTEAL
jgi:hypothetical protein